MAVFMDGKYLSAMGTHAWKVSKEELGGGLSNLMLVNNMIVVTIKQDGKSHVFLLSQKDGSKMGSFQLPAEPVYMGLSASNKRLYISCSDGTLLSYGE